MRRKVTHHSVEVARRSKIGATLDLTDEDRAEMARKEEERLARLARIAARQRGEIDD